VKLDDPAVAGVPDKIPDVLSVSPAGNWPEDTLKVYGSAPPVAASAALYAWPTAPPGRLVVVTAKGAVSE
jgi:hypothetical protein